MSERQAPYAVANLVSIGATRSKIEREWAAIGNVILKDELGEYSAVKLYEPFSVNLPGGRYTPDFMHILEDGRIIFVEIKGSKKQRGYRDARSKLRAAAELHPWFVWVEARRDRDGWTIERINA